MKHTIITLSILMGLLLSAPARAQNSTPYDCFSVYTFSGTGSQTAQNNASSSSPCVAWRVTYTSTGFSSVTVAFQVSSDGASFSSVPNTACSSSVTTACTTEGASPITAGVQGTGAYKAYAKYVRVTVSSVTGSGSGQVVVYGYKGNGASASSSGGSDGGSACPLASFLGFALDGSDETTLLNSTLGAFYTAGGGCLAIDPAKTLRADGQIVFPTSGSPNWAAPAYRITGFGPGQGNSGEAYTIVGGSILDLRYHGSGITALGGGPKLWALGYGSLEIDHVTITDGASDCGAFLMTNGARLYIHQATFSSSLARGAGCNDAIILGGTGGYPRAGAITDPFFGFGTVIEQTAFLNMARVAVMQGNVNQITFADNYVFGGNSSSPGPIIQATTGGSGTNLSNVIRGNTFEGCSGPVSCAISYNCALKLADSQEWTIDSNGWYDVFGASPFLCGAANTIRNNVGKNNYLDITATTFTDPNWSTNNYMPYRAFPFFFDGGGAALSGTTTRCGLLSFGGIINRFSMLADQSGNATVTVKAVALASYTGPGSTTDISNGGETMSGAVTKVDSTLTGWTYTDVAAKDTIPPNTIVCFTLTSPSTITWLSGNIQIWEGR